MSDVHTSVGFGQEVSDASKALFQSAVEDPINGLKTFLDPSAKEWDPIKPSANDIGATIGKFAGFGVDLFGVSRVLGSAVAASNLADTGAIGSALASREGIMVSSGIVYGGVLTPEKGSAATQYFDRLKTAAVYGGSFLTMGVAARETDALAASATKQWFAGSATSDMLARGGLKIGSAMASGFVGGLASAELQHGFTANASDLLKTGADYAVLGGAFSGTGMAFDVARSATSRIEAMRVAGRTNWSSVSSRLAAGSGRESEGGAPGATPGVTDSPEANESGPVAATEHSEPTTGGHLWTPAPRHIEVASAQTEYDLTQPWTDNERILKAQQYERESTPPTLRINPAKQVFPTHEGTTDTDVLVVGGGVAGLMAGSRLASAGADVSLVDADTIASRTTARGAAMFTRDPDVTQSDYAQMFGEDQAAAHLQRLDVAQQKVIQVAENSESFVNHGSYRISYDADDEYIVNDYNLIKKLNPEANVRLLSGADAARETGVPGAQTALAFDGEGSADPREVSMRLARTPGLNVYENSPVVGLKVPSDGGAVEVRMANGSSIRANRVVFATGGTVAPFSYLNEQISAEQCFAGQAAIFPDQAVNGNIFDQGIEGVQRNDDDYNYFRMMHESGLTGSGKPQLLMGSDSHFLDDQRPARTTAVVNRALDHLFPGASVNARWTGTIFDTEDGAPIVAQNPEHPQLFAVTGVGGIGWVNSSLAADDLTQRLVGGNSTGPYDLARLDDIQHSEEEDG